MSGSDATDIVADTYFCRAKNKQKHHIFITNYTQERPTSKTSPPAVKKKNPTTAALPHPAGYTRRRGAIFIQQSVPKVQKNFFILFFFDKYTNGPKLFWLTQLYFITHFGCPGLMFSLPQHFPPRRAHRAHFLAKLFTYLLISSWGKRVHSSSVQSSSSLWVMGWRFATRRFNSAHSSSIGFKSGEWLGHPTNTSIPFVARMLRSPCARKRRPA